MGTSSAISWWGDSQDADYSPDQVDLVSRIANQISGAVANVVLREELELESSQAVALAEISRAAGSSLNLTEIMDRITPLWPGLLPFDRFQLDSIDLSAGTMTVEIHRPAPLLPQSAVGRRNPLRDSLSSVAAATGNYQIVNAANRDDLTSKLPMLKESFERGLKSLVSAPLISDGVVIGTLSISSDGPLEYSEEHGEFLQRVADQLGGVLSAALRYRDEQRESEIQELLTRVARAATGGLEPIVLFSQIEAELRTEFDYDRFEALLAESDGETLRFACIRGLSVGDLEQGDIVPGGVQTLRNWGPILERSAADSPKHDHLIESGLNSWIQVPIGFPSDSPIGFIGIRSRGTNTYTEDDAKTFGRIAGQITPALQNARTHQQSIELAAERERSMELEQQAGELQRLNEEKSQFLETVTHELKTPLTSIQAFTDLLLRNREGNLTDRQIRNLNVSSRNARRLGILIDDLVDVSQIQTGSFELHESEFDLVDLTNDLVESMQPILGDKEQSLKYQLIPSTIWLRADRARIAQVITNLLSNASKYSPSGSSIVFCVDVERSDVLLEVQDDGSGIADADIPHLFTPLFRADNEETRAVPGTGIGLAIVKRIVDVHGGEINVSSQVGVGSKFKVSLPRQVTKPSAEYLAEQKAIVDKSTPRSRFSELPPE
jgi:signal transduction histidine kinase